MKKKAGAFLLTMLLAISAVTPVYAEEGVSLLTTDNSTYYGAYFESYDIVEMGLTCFFQFHSDRSVTAGTALSNVTVTINSKAYSSAGASIGSGGNAGVGSTSTSYSTNVDIGYCVNEHSSPASGITVTINVSRR